MFSPSGIPALHGVVLLPSKTPRSGFVLLNSLATTCSVSAFGSRPRLAAHVSDGGGDFTSQLCSSHVSCRL